MIKFVPKMQVLVQHALLAIGCVIYSGSELIAQESKQPLFIYISGGGGFGSATHGFVELHTVFMKHHGVSVGYNSLRRDAESTPGDYQGGLLSDPFDRPKIRLNSFAVTYSYVFYDKDPRVADLMRFPVSIGALIGTYSEPGNFQRGGPLLGANYVYDDLKKPDYSLIVRAGFECLPLKAVGFRAGLFGVVGNMPAFGAYAGIMIGHVGDRERSKHQPAN